MFLPSGHCRSRDGIVPIEINGGSVRYSFDREARFREDY